MSETDNDIGKWRVLIDEIDEKLLELFNRRAEYACEIGEIKRKLGLPIYVPEREDQIYDHIRETNPGPLPNSAVVRLFERIIDETRRLEREQSKKGND